jgi:putative FmdB family regulatory protein
MTYEYTCTNCKHNWEEHQKITAAATKICPACNKDTAKRLISKGQGFILSGSGWFKSGGY